MMLMLATLAAAATYVEAVVKVELTADPQGKVVACTVLESNAPAETSDLTCQGLIAAASFEPTGMPEKRITAVHYRVPAPAPSPAPAADPAYTSDPMPVEVSLDAQGAVTGCRMPGSVYGKNDEVVCMAMLRDTRFEPARDSTGRPVPSTRRTSVRLRVPRAAIDQALRR